MVFIRDENSIHKNKIIFKKKRYENAKREIGKTYKKLTIVDIDYNKTEYEYSLGHYYVGVCLKKQPLQII